MTDNSNTWTKVVPSLIAFCIFLLPIFTPLGVFASILSPPGEEFTIVKPTPEASSSVPIEVNKPKIELPSKQELVQKPTKKHGENKEVSLPVENQTQEQSKPSPNEAAKKVAEKSTTKPVNEKQEKKESLPVQEPVVIEEKKSLSPPETTPPVITFTDDVEVGPVQVENVVVEIFDENFDTYSFIYTLSTVCDATQDFSEAFGPGEFTSAINTETYNNHYICIRAEDTFDNVTYKRSANPLNIDATAPEIIFSDNVEMGPVGTDYVQIGTSDLNLSSYSYGFSSDNVCNASDTYGNNFVNNGVITFSDSSHNGKYLCVMAVDSVGNTTYRASAFAFNIDNDYPVITFDNDVEQGPVKEDRVNIAVNEANLSELKYYASTDNVCEETDTYLGLYNVTDDIIFNTTTYNGMYLCFWATDDLGHTTSKVSSYTLNIDIIPPEIVKVDNLEGRPMQEDRIVLTINGDDVETLQWGYSPDQGCTGFDDYPYTFEEGVPFYINDSSHNGEYLCFRAIDEAGNEGYEQSNIVVNIDGSVPELEFINDVSGGYVASEAIEVQSTVGNTDEIYYGYSVDNACDASDTYVGTVGSNDSINLEDETYDGQYVCLRTGDSEGNTFYESSEQPLNIDPLPDYNDFIYIQTLIPDSFVDELDIWIYVDNMSYTITNTGFAFSNDEICDGLDSYTSLDASSMVSDDGGGNYTLTINTEDYNGQYLCVMATNDQGLTQYMGDYIDGQDLLPIYIDSAPPQLNLIVDVDDGLSSTKTITVNASDSHLHLIEYGVSQYPNDCPDSAFEIQDGFSHEQAVFRPWTGEPQQDTFEISGDYNGWYICIRAVDAAGKIHTINSSQILNLDSEDPIITVNDGVSLNPGTSDTIQFDIYKEGNLQFVKYAFASENCEDIIPTNGDGLPTLDLNHNYIEGDPNSYTSSYEFVIDNDDNSGDLLCIFILDEAGNLTRYTSEYRICVDTTPPEIDFSDDNSGNPENDQEIRIETGEANLTIFAWGYSPTPECPEDGIYVNPIGEDGVIPIVDEEHAGQYICVIAVDDAGNTTIENVAIVRSPADDSTPEVPDAHVITLAQTGINLQGQVVFGLSILLSLLSSLFVTDYGRMKKLIVRFLT